MAKVEIYSSLFCGFSTRAKGLLREKGVDFVEIDLLAMPERRPEMVERAGGKRSVPRIFIDDVHIGGAQELFALEASGDLDRLLESGQGMQR